MKHAEHAMACLRQAFKHAFEAMSNTGHHRNRAGTFQNVRVGEVVPLPLRGIFLP